jgi:hypothetical protein
MPFGIIRVINAEILWLDVNGRFREISSLSYRTNDRESGFKQARVVHGLCARLPERVNGQNGAGNAPGCPPARRNEGIPLEIPQSEAEIAGIQAESKRLLADLRSQLRVRVPDSSTSAPTELGGA